MLQSDDVRRIESQRQKQATEEACLRRAAAYAAWCATKELHDAAASVESAQPDQDAKTKDSENRKKDSKREY